MRADELHADVLLPEFAHAFGRVAAPALAVRVSREGAAINALQIHLVQPAGAGGVKIGAVVKHEAVHVRVAEVFEAADLHAPAVHAAIDVADELIRAAEPHQVDEGIRLRHGLDILRVRLALRGRAAHVGIAIHEPRDARARRGRLVDLLHAHAGCADEVSPPAVVLLAGLPQVLKLPHGRTTTDDDVFRFRERGQSEGGGEEEDAEEAHGEVCGFDSGLTSAR